MGNADSFMTSREAAQILGVSLSTIQLWTENGLLRAWKTPGGHRRISSESVEALRRQQLDALGKGGEQPQGESGQPVVLVVEDEEAERKLYRLQLTELPIRLLTAVDGFDGLLKAGQHSPAVIITDLRMPGMDGFQMVRALKQSASEGGSAPTLVVVTSLRAEEIEERGGLPDDVTVLHKPTPFPVLKQLLQDQFARAPQSVPTRSV